MNALTLLYKQATAMPRTIRGSTVTSRDVDLYLRNRKRTKNVNDSFSMHRVLNGVKWGAGALGLGGAAYVANG